MKTAAERAAAASLAHGLAHEVAALTEAKILLVTLSPAEAFAQIQQMIATRKDRVAQLGVEVACAA
jgi:hypothetical protein